MMDMVIGVTNGSERYPDCYPIVDDSGTLWVVPHGEVALYKNRGVYARGYWSHVWYEEPREEEKP